MIPVVERTEGIPAVVTDPQHAVGVMTDLFARIDADPEFAATIGKSSMGNPISITAVTSPSKWADKQIRKSQAAGQDWVDGVQNPRANFKDAAIAAKGKFKQRTTEALNSGKWEAKMAKVNVDEAIATAVAVGPQGYVNGITARTAKIQRVVAQLQPLVTAVKQTIQQMPQDTDQQREARMIAARRGMIEVGKKLAGS